MTKSKVKDMAVSARNSVVGGAQHAGQQVESIATLGFAGIAEDRVSKVLVAVSGGVVITGAIIGSKLVVFAGVGVFGAGFVRGFKKALVTLQEQQKEYDDVVDPRGEGHDDKRKQ